MVSHLLYLTLILANMYIFTKFTEKTADTSLDKPN